MTTDMKYLVTPWSRAKYQRWRFNRCFLNTDIIGPNGRPWLLAIVWKRTSKRWYYEAWIQNPYEPSLGKRRGPRAKIEGYTYSAAKSKQIIDNWLDKRKILKMIPTDRFKKLIAFQ